jgi:AcrR family transcriptional regulator
MDDVARELGGSKGQVYYYFKSKDELLSSMSLYVHEIYEQWWVPIIANKDLSPQMKLEKIARNHIISMCHDWNMHRALWTNMWFASLDQKNFKTVVAIRRKIRKGMEELVTAIRGPKEDSKVSNKIKARLIESVLDGVAGWYRPDGGQTPEEISEIVVKTINGIVTA